MADRLIHTIDPVWDAHARVLILGSFPSPKSRESDFFYGHPQNRFWRVLAEVLERPVPATNEEKRDLLLGGRIALWDVLHACEITGASDASIRDPVPNDLSPILRGADIRTIYTTGATAARLYKKHIQPTTGRAAVSLPSTSPANCGRSFESLCESYRIIIKSCLEDVT